MYTASPDVFRILLRQVLNRTVSVFELEQLAIELANLEKHNMLHYDEKLIFL